MADQKSEVRTSWEEASCGEALYLGGLSREDYIEQSRRRYELEPQISFGEFHRYKGKRTLEIGVGLGADHQKLAEAGADLYGVDLTSRAIEHTKRRFELFGLSSDLQVADAENLPYPDEFFDAIYSWGVVHHSPDTPKAIAEIYRVLKPGGLLKIMIYNKYSIIGWMLWSRYALLRLRPWRSLDDVYAEHLESPGTKAYSHDQARALLSRFTVDSLETPLGHAELLESNVGQRHRGFLLTFVRRIWPRRLLKRLAANRGLGMMITCYRPRGDVDSST